MIAGIPQMRRLFTPGAIGNLEVKNRLILAPMGTFSLEPNGGITDRTIAFYLERAKGGVGLILGQAARISPRAYRPNSSAGWDDKYIPRYRELAESVQQEGARVGWQVVHAGKRMAQWYGGDGEPGIAPSAIPWVATGKTPREATRDDIAGLIDDFARAARRLKDAGFDLVEIHGAHGLLISQFLSPRDNKRTDEYGGSVKKRARFACEVISGVRKSVGPSFPVIFRFSVCDFLEGGTSVEDSVQQAPMFVEAGADALHISAGASESRQWVIPCYLFPDGLLVPAAAAIKKSVGVPVIVAGKISDPLLAERILEEGQADFISMGRAFIADPEFANKTKTGRINDIWYCVHCNNCQGYAGLREWQKGFGISCTVNPTLLEDKEVANKPADNPRKVMVVGGGLAGMKAAQILARRGHVVSLYEKGDSLGGQWKVASQLASKNEYAKLAEHLARDLKQTGVKVVLNKEVDRAFAIQEEPDAIVVATGATPKGLDVPGAGGKNVTQAVDVLSGKAEIGNSVVVIGGRYLGIEAATLLAELGKMVSLVTQKRLGENGKPLEPTILLGLRDRLIQSGVHVYPNCPVVEITENGVYIDYDRSLLFLKADAVVLAVGTAPENTLFEELKGVTSVIHQIGDCVEPRDALDAMHDAVRVAHQI